MSKHSGLSPLKMLFKNKKKKVSTQKVSVGRDDLENSPRLDLQNNTIDHPVSKEAEPLADEKKRFSSRKMAVQNNYRTKRSYQKKNIFDSMRNLAASIFKKRSKESDALDFAANHRRRSKKEKRRRRVFIYAGTAMVLAAVFFLVFVLLPGDAAAPAGAAVLLAQENTGIIAAKQAGITPLGAKMPYPMPFSAVFDHEDSDIYAYPLEDISEDIQDPEPDVTPEPAATTSPDPTPVPLKVEDFLDYFEVKADAYYSDAGYSNNSYKYTQEEYLMLARIIHGEARGQSFRGQVAVGNVIMNRVLCRGAWPNSITAVVSAPGQFSPYARVKDLSASQINSTSKRAARAILEKELWVIPQDVYFFRSAGRYRDLKGQNWGSHAYYDEIGGHFFYRHRYSGRKRDAGVPPALYERTYKYAQYGCKPQRRVHRIQYMLNKLGYDVRADSYFGETTKIALIEFQNKYSLTADGIAGPSTVKRLIEEFGVQNYYDRFIKK